MNMKQYIKKSDLVAGIEKLKGQLLRGACSSQVSMETNCKEEAYNEVLSLLDTVEDEEERIRKAILGLTYLDGIEPILAKCSITAQDIRAWLEKQGKDKEINNFDVLPGLYVCIHRMFDGTRDGRLLFEVGKVYKCLSKHDRAEFEVSYGHSVYLEDPIVCKHFIPIGNQDEQKPAEWSEEDEYKLYLLNALCDDQINNTTHSTIYRSMHELKDWLKSLKKRLGV